VRKTPSWSRRWANSSPFIAVYSCTPTGMHGLPTRISCGPTCPLLSRVRPHRC
jgi:hypothetical protein